MAILLPALHEGRKSKNLVEKLEKQEFFSKQLRKKKKVGMFYLSTLEEVS